jgi:hypothetical protein
MRIKTQVRSGVWRSRWAAVGAAVAVTLGAGSLVAVNAASSAPSSFVSITPTRILDTRTDVGLAGPFVSTVAQTLRVTGTVATQPPGNAAPVDAEVVPAAATSVVFNVTVVRPSTKGFLSVRPGDASGFPATSNINWAAGGANIANAVTVQLPASGDVNIFVNGTVGHVLIDVAGYNEPATAGPAGPTGPTGPTGPEGPEGPEGSSGSALQVVDATGEVVGDYVEVGYAGSQLVVAVGEAFVEVSAFTGEQRHLVPGITGPGKIYFESDDCSGPPAAVTEPQGGPLPPFDLEKPVWPPEGPDRKSYEVTDIDVSFEGTSTRFNSNYEDITEIGTGCNSGPQVGPSFALAVVEDPDGVVLKEYVGPLWVQVAP